MPPKPNRLLQTPSQTSGPYLHIGLMPNGAGIEGLIADDLGSGPVRPDAAMLLTGGVFDGRGDPVGDAVLEFWQAGAGEAGQGRFGRSACDPTTGHYRTEIANPGPQTAMVSGRAPFIDIWIFARGLNRALRSRAYFPDHTQANAVDPLLTSIEDPLRRATLLAALAEDGYIFDIHLQGERETVFLEG